MGERRGLIITAAVLVAAGLLACKGSDAAPATGGRGAAMLDPERDKMLRPDALVARLHLKPGQTVADLGAGPGYLTLRIARAVGPSGHVIATDVDGGALATLTQRARAQGLTNLDTRPVAPDDPGLAPSRVELALLCHVDAFLPDREAWLRRLAPALTTGGRLAVVGWAPGRQALLEAATRAGYHIVDEDEGLLPAQFLLFLSPS